MNQRHTQSNPIAPNHSRRRQRSLYCNPTEQAMIRARANAAGTTISRYVIKLALADDPDRHPLVLDEQQQTELRDAILELQDFVRTLPCQLLGTGRLELLNEIDVMTPDPSP